MVMVTATGELKIEEWPDSGRRGTPKLTDIAGAAVASTEAAPGTVETRWVDF